MKNILSLVLLSLPFGIQASADTDNTLHGDGISIECSLATAISMDDMLISYTKSEMHTKYRDVRCVRLETGKIVIWIRPKDPLSSGGGWTYIFENDLLETYEKQAGR